MAGVLKYFWFCLYTFQDIKQSSDKAVWNYKLTLSYIVTKFEINHKTNVRTARNLKKL